MDLEVMRDIVGELEKYRECIDKKALKKVVDETRTWLSTNRESFVADGGRVDRPWWPVLAKTDNNSLKLIRLFDLDARVWEHGLQQFVHLLARKSGVVRTAADLKARKKARSRRKKNFNLFADIATDPMTSVVLRELVKFKFGKDEKLREQPYTTLAHIRELHRCGTDQSAQNVRDRMLELALFGLIRMELNSKSYLIEIGPAGLAFFNDVYLPVRNDPDRYISGTEETDHA